MYCGVLACDFDGTLIDDGCLAPEVVAAPAEASSRGVAAILVTGRVVEDLRLAEVDMTGFDTVAAENGAVVWLPARDRFIQLGNALPTTFSGSCGHAASPLIHAGAVVVGRSDRHAAEILELVRVLGLDSQLIFNRTALMLLSSGVSKATGVRRAWRSSGAPEHNMIAFGDAENDLPLLAAARVGVAARGAGAALLSVVDDRLTQPAGAGVVRYVGQRFAQEKSRPRKSTGCPKSPISRVI